MTNREADTIVHDLQGMRSNSDFSQVGSQIREMQQHDPAHFQRNLAQINESVDMRNLGFPSDFKIAGVDDHNHLVTISEDGRTVEQRNMRNMHVDRTSPNTAQPEQWGNREVTTNPVDGSRNYTSKPGDNLWSIARDSLQHQSGERPNNTQISEQVRNIARENHIADPNKLPVGTELRLPNPDAQRPEQQRPDQQRPEQRPDRPNGPYSPNLPVDSPALQPRDGASNPVAVPGLAGAQDPAVADRTQGLTQRLENGNTVTTYSGKLNDGYIRDTRFTSEQTTDQNGRLIHSVVDYQKNFAGNGADLTLSTPTGNQTIAHVSRVETNFNSRTGRYDTTINTNDGTSYRAVTGRDGRVISYVQSQGPAD